MTETLVIRLRASDDAPASWLIVDANGARSGSVHSGPIDDALALSQGRRTVVVLPAADVTLARPDLPPVRGANRIAQAVPFALEEHLASDLENLHFAIGQRDASSSATPVAIIARSHARALAGRVGRSGHPPGRRLRRVVADPVRAERAGAGARRGHAARQPARMPLLTRSTPSRCHWRSIWRSASRPRPASTSRSTCRRADYETHKDTIEGLRARTATLQVKLLPDGTLSLLAAQVPVARPINLLQGAYAAPTSFGSQLKQWRLPAALAAATLVAFIGVQGFKLWQLHQAEKQLDAQITATFNQILPGQPIVDPRAQIQGVLARAGGGNGALLPAISLLAQAIAQSPATRVQAISFRAGVLELHLLAPNVEALDGIKQAMSRDGATVELQSANPRDQQVEGRLQVRLGAA